MVEKRCGTCANFFPCSTDSVGVHCGVCSVKSTKGSTPMRETEGCSTNWTPVRVEICPQCRGSGWGIYMRTDCSTCSGLGTVPAK